MMIEFIFRWRIFVLFGFDKDFSLDLSFTNRFKVIFVCDNLIFVDNHVKFMDWDLVLFGNQSFEAVNVGNYVDSEESLIVLLDVFNLEGFHLLDSDVLLDVIDFFIPVNDLFNKSNHFFDSLNVIFF
jgi:hypothetical protein